MVAVVAVGIASRTTSSPMTTSHLLMASLVEFNSHNTLTGLADSGQIRQGTVQEMRAMLKSHLIKSFRRTLSPRTCPYASKITSMRHI